MIVWVVITEDVSADNNVGFYEPAVYTSFGAALRSIPRDRWRAAFRRKRAFPDGQTRRDASLLRLLWPAGPGAVLAERDDGTFRTWIVPTEVRQ